MSGNAKPPFTFAAKRTFVIAGFTALHATTLLLAGCVWVFAGVKFPPFARYDDGMLLFTALSCVGGFATGFSSVNPCVYGWRE